MRLRRNAGRLRRGPMNPRFFLVFLFALVLVLLCKTRPVAAHASDFETLTIDFLLTTDGLSAIDAALNSAPGPSYEPFPSEEERRSVAVAVLGSLGIDLAKADINAAMSDRYHEVGFTVRLREAYTNAGSGELRIETAQLQRIASERKVKHLKVSLCDTNGDSFTASGMRTDSFNTATMSTTRRSTAGASSLRSVAT